MQEGKASWSSAELLRDRPGNIPWGGDERRPAVPQGPGHFSCALEGQVVVTGIPPVSMCDVQGMNKVLLLLSLLWIIVL